MPRPKTPEAKSPYTKLIEQTNGDVKRAYRDMNLGWIGGYAAGVADRGLAYEAGKADGYSEGEISAWAAANEMGRDERAKAEAQIEVLEDNIVRVMQLKKVQIADAVAETEARMLSKCLEHEQALVNALATTDKALDDERAAAEALVALVNEQAEDEGLWFVAQYASEGYLQQELRRLHGAIEAAYKERREDGLAALHPFQGIEEE